MLLLSLFVSFKIFGRELITFDASKANSSDALVLNFLQKHTNSFIERSELEGFTVTDCATVGSQYLRVCNDIVESKPDAGIVFHYGIDNESMAYLLGRAIPKSSTVVFVGAITEISVYSHLKSNGLDIKFVDEGRLKRLYSKREKLYHRDILLIGKNISMPKKEREKLIQFYKKNGVTVITSSRCDFGLGTDYAVMVNQESILENFISILKFYRRTGILKTSRGMCRGYILDNKKIEIAEPLPLHSSRYLEALENLEIGCGVEN